MLNYILLFITLIATVGGQIILKFGQKTLYFPKNLSYNEILNFITQSIFNKFTISSVLFTSIGIITWLMIIQRMKLSIAYPFMSLSYVIVFLVSYFIFKESIFFNQIIGLFLIIIGVIFLSIKL
nr:EamA family transporter [Candidatus Gracilibacteria bacterium]